MPRWILPQRAAALFLSLIHILGLFNSVINFTIIMLFNKFSKKISEVSLW